MEEVSSKTHDLIEPDEVVVKAQRMFPNCQKYKKCCSDDKEFWDKLDKKVKEWKPLKHNFRIKNLKLEYKKPPKGFEDMKKDLKILNS